MTGQSPKKMSCRLACAFGLRPNLKGDPDKNQTRYNHQKPDLAHSRFGHLTQRFQHAFQKRRGQCVHQPLENHHQPESQKDQAQLRAP